jgi:nitroreductase
MSPPWGPRPVPPRVHLLLFVHRVDGLTPGLYALPRRADALPELQEVLREEFQWQTPEECPPHLPLYRLMEADARKSALLLACRQLIAGGGAFSPAMLGEFEHALEAGPWGYRRLMTEAGLIGEALYLGAEASGLQGTGIGRFFDDGLHELFGLRDRRYQVLYQFTVGKGRPDSRIGSEAAYPEFRGQEIQPPAASRGRRRKHGLRKLNRGLLLPPHTSSVRGEASLEMGLLAAPRAAAWRLVDDESILVSVPGPPAAGGGGRLAPFVRGASMPCYTILHGPALADLGRTPTEATRNIRHGLASNSRGARRSLGRDSHNDK